MGSIVVLKRDGGAANRSRAATKANERAHERHARAAMPWAATARGDDELIMYLVGEGVDVTAVARSGQTTADMANGPVQRISPFLGTVALLESLGSKNNHRCVGC